MTTDVRRKLHIAETAMLLSLCISLCFALWGSTKSSALSDKLIRLHVIAASDDEYEQALKLRVRDAVLESTQAMLGDTGEAAGAYNVLEDNLSAIKTAAESAAEGRAVEVTLSSESYPTRYYDGFALPAGQYNSLRVMLGEAEGQNWWCVVFPPLCTSASVEAVSETLSETELGVITQDDEGYVLRFRAMELWGEFRSNFN